jgi:hypothetical protein
MHFPLLKVVVLMVGVMTAYVIRQYWINPKVLTPVCLIDSDRCVRLEYFRRKNTALVYVFPSNWVLWFNGEKFYVYQVGNTGRTCTDPNFQPAFEIRPRNRKVDEYTCIRNLKSVQEYYPEASKEYAYFSVPDPNAYSAFDVAQFLIERQIIRLPRDFL